MECEETQMRRPVSQPFLKQNFCDYTNITFQSHKTPAGKYPHGNKSEPNGSGNEVRFHLHSSSKAVFNVSSIQKERLKWIDAASNSGTAWDLMRDRI